MLILSRCYGESIVIGKGKNKVTLTILQNSGYSTKIGIDAPKDVPVHRQEIYQKIHAEKTQDSDSK